MTEIRVPDGIEGGDDEIVLSAWYHDDGAAVSEGTTVCEVMIAKAQVEISAPASGMLRISASVETVVKVGQVIGHIETP